MGWNALSLEGGPSGTGGSSSTDGPTRMFGEERAARFEWGYCQGAKALSQKTGVQPGQVA
jgi:hypothetical protein